MEDNYTDLYTTEPDRGDEIEIPDDVPKSASQAENMSPNDSDLQTTLKRLFPTFDDSDINRIAQVIMLGRVFPDNFSEKVRLIVVGIALKHYNDPAFDVIQTMMIIEGIAQIGLDGKGRVETVVVSGNAREQVEQEIKMGAY